MWSGKGLIGPSRPDGRKVDYILRWGVCVLGEAFLCMGNAWTPMDVIRVNLSNIFLVVRFWTGHCQLASSSMPWDFALPLMRGDVHLRSYDLAM